MDDSIRNAVLFGGLALACGGLGWWRPHGARLAAALALGGLLLAAGLGVLPLGGWRVWLAGLPGAPLALLAGWALLGLGLRRLGGLAGGRWDLLACFVGGAAYGAPPVALAAAGGIEPRRAARLVLAAVAGGLCGPLGHEPLLLLGGARLLPSTLPLGLGLGLLLLLPWPREPVAAGASAGGSRALTLGALPCWLLASFVHTWLGLALALLLCWGAVALSRGAGRPWPRPRRLVAVLAALVGVSLLLPAGVLDLLAWGLEDIRVLLGSLQAPAFGLGSVAGGALAGGAPLALAAALASASDPVAFAQPLLVAVVAGGAVGSSLLLLALAGPGVLRAGAARWSLSLALVLAWLALPIAIPAW